MLGGETNLPTHCISGVEVDRGVRRHDDLDRVVIQPTKGDDVPDFVVTIANAVHPVHLIDALNRELESDSRPMIRMIFGSHDDSAGEHTDRGEKVGLLFIFDGVHSDVPIRGAL